MLDKENRFTNSIFVHLRTPTDLPTADLCLPLGRLQLTRQNMSITCPLPFTMMNLPVTSRTHARYQLFRLSNCRQSVSLPDVSHHLLELLVINVGINISTDLSLKTNKNTTRERIAREISLTRNLDDFYERADFSGRLFNLQVRNGSTLDSEHESEHFIE